MTGTVEVPEVNRGSEVREGLGRPVSRRQEVRRQETQTLWRL